MMIVVAASTVQPFMVERDMNYRRKVSKILKYLYHNIDNKYQTGFKGYWIGN